LKDSDTGKRYISLLLESLYINL